ncbi:MAG: diacylglycerol/lipid kinase family protein [Pirellulaceae bacterium]
MATERIVMIWNPKSGRGRAARRLAKVPDRWTDGWEVIASERPGHARELARELASECSMVVAAGGDGTVHEVAGGLLESEANCRLGILPIGSANDFAWSLLRQLARSSSHGGVLGKVDVARVVAGDGRSRYFVENLGTGLSGEVTRWSRRIPWLQGTLLYSVAAAMAIVCHRGYRIACNGKGAEESTLLMSIMLGRREGGFLMCPDARNDDGLFDLVHARGLNRWGALHLLPRVAIWGAPRQHPKIHRSQATQVLLESDRALTVHTDGELMLLPEDQVTRLEVELLKGRLQVEVFSGW